MIAVSNNIRRLYRSAFSKARAEKIRCVRLSPTLYYVARKANGHGQYLVRFSEIPTIGGPSKVTVWCRTIDDKQCKGCWGGRCCVHIAKAIEMGIKYGQRRQQKAA